MITATVLIAAGSPNPASSGGYPARTNCHYLLNDRHAFSCQSRRSSAASDEFALGPLERSTGFPTLERHCH